MRLLPEIKKAGEELYKIGKIIVPRAERSRMLRSDIPTADALQLRLHYKHRPLDRIHDGLLVILDKSGSRVRFKPNYEQAQLLEYIEGEYYKRRPVRFIGLKPRQIGLSTVSEAIIYCLCIDSTCKTAHIVANKRITSRRMKRMFVHYHENMPEFLRPKMTLNNAEGMGFNDPEYGCEDTFIRLGSAEERDKLGLGDTCQFNHFTEVAEWPSVAELMAALNPSIPAGWPSIVGRESTGKAVGDLFYTEFHEAWEGRKPGWKAFFWPWFVHEEYKLALPSHVAPEEFVAQLPDDDRLLGQAFDLTVEQLNWHWTTEREWGSSRDSKDGMTEVFRNKYPSTIDEAFAGGGSNFFNTEFLRRDAHRVERTTYVDDLTYLPPSSIYDLEAPVICCKAQLSRDTSVPLDKRRPAFIPDPMGEWRVWEMPPADRRHRYVVTVDVAEGKQSVKGAKDSTDFSVIDVYRYTYGEREMAAIVQVAQRRTKALDTHELAREAKAVAQLYAGKDAGVEEEALVMPESNAVGASFIAEGMELGMRFYRQNRSNTRWDGQQLQQEIGFRQRAGGGDGSKLQLITQGREAWRNGHLIINSPQTCREMGVFAQNDKGRYEAIKPHHDDTVITAMMAPEGVRFISGSPNPVPLQPSLYSHLHPRTAAMQDTGEPPPKIDKSQYLATPKHKRGVTGDDYAAIAV